MRSQKYLLHLVLAAVVVSLAGTQLSQAQMPGMPKLYGEFKMPTVGAYVTYKVTYPQQKQERLTKMSIVGKEKSPKGQDLYWFEQEETDPKTGDVDIIKMLISGNPQEIGTISRMIVKSGKDEASELPQAMIKMINQAPTEKKDSAKPKIKNLGLEKVKVKDQIMSCTHMSYANQDSTMADVWTNAKVPLFGMVKSVTPLMTMELVAQGANAVTAIKEQPKQLELPEAK
ncbi:MAG: hypothetical protein WCE90_11055 [Candidatus Zixiibacteriota bacterium]